jgi:hypothetical protein
MPMGLMQVAEKVLWRVGLMPKFIVRRSEAYRELTEGSRKELLWRALVARGRNAETAAGLTVAIVTLMGVLMSTGSTAASLFASTVVLVTWRDFRFWYFVYKGALLCEFADDAGGDDSQTMDPDC